MVLVYPFLLWPSLCFYQYADYENDVRQENCYIEWEQTKSLVDITLREISNSVKKCLNLGNAINIIWPWKKSRINGRIMFEMRKLK